MKNRILGLVAAIGLVSGLAFGQAGFAQTAPSAEQARQAATARVAQSTVKIHVEGQKPMDNLPNLPGFDFGPNGKAGMQSFRSDSSGFVVDAARGEIVTSAYAVEKAETITVTLADGTSRKARLAGIDMTADIAVLRTDPAGLVAVTWADGATVGEDCAIYGQAASLGLVATFGEVAGTNLHAEDAPAGIMAVSALESPGMAGAPVFDMKGRVIGMAYARLDNPAIARAGLGIVLTGDLVRKTVQAVTAGR